MVLHEIAKRCYRCVAVNGEKPLGKRVLDKFKMAEYKEKCKESIIQIPSLDYMQILERESPRQESWLFDTNVFFPSFYNRETHHTIPNLKIDEFVVENLDNGNITKDCLKKIRIYIQEYQQRIKGILKGNPNIYLLDKVEEECDRGNGLLMRVNRANRRNLKYEKRSNHANALRFAENLTKTRKNNLDSCLDLIPKENIISTKKLMEQGIYRGFLAVLLKISDMRKIPYNNLQTDQHLIAAATYLSCMNQEKINIYTYDKDLVTLLLESYQTITASSIKHKIPKRNISIYRPSWKKKKFGMSLNEIVNENLSKPVFQRISNK